MVREASQAMVGCASGARLNRSGVTLLAKTKEIPRFRSISRHLLGKQIIDEDVAQMSPSMGYRIPLDEKTCFIGGSGVQAGASRLNTGRSRTNAGTWIASTRGSRKRGTSWMCAAPTSTGGR